MSRDFANKKTTRKKPAATPKKPEKKNRSGLIYLAIGLIVGLFVAFLVYLDKIPSDKQSTNAKFAHPNNQKGNKAKISNKKTTKQQVKAKKVVKKNEPQFDFYEMLPDMQVEVNEPVVEKKVTSKPEPAEKKTLAKPSSNNVVTKKQIPHQLQVGAFQSLDKADSMKARLAFLGIESNISIVWINSNKKIYRVRIGPSKDLKELEKMRNQLRAQNINAILQKAL